MWEGSKAIKKSASNLRKKIEVVFTFGRASVPQRLKNQALYHEIILLQKFNDISRKVLEQARRA